MQVEFLKGLGLDDEVIKKIQAESGKDVTAAKEKMQTQIDSITTQVTDLQGQVTQRDTDLNNLKTQLEQAGQSASKLSEVQQSFTDLQSKYDHDTNEFKTKLDNQSYEFSVKEAMAGVKFSSNAAKKEFLKDLMENKLPLKDGSILGFEEYVTKQKESDPGAFVIEQDPPANQNNPTQKPNFAPPAKPTNEPPKDSEFGFHFLGVRKPTEQ